MLIILIFISANNTANIFIISTDEDPSLRIESSAIINLRGVSTKLNKYIDYIVHEDENVSRKSPITPSNTMVINDNLSPIFKTTSLEKSSLSSRSVGGIIQEFITTFMHTMSHRLKKQLVHYLYKLLVIELGGMPLYQLAQEDFLDVSFKCNEHFI